MSNPFAWWKSIPRLKSTWSTSSSRLRETFRRCISALTRCYQFVYALVQLSYRLMRYWVWAQVIFRFGLGYGERPGRVLLLLTAILVVPWLTYWQGGAFVLDVRCPSVQTGHPSWSDALYYSLVSLSALGYGSWAPQPVGWARWVGAVQPILGIIGAVALSISIAQRIRR